MSADAKRIVLFIKSPKHDLKSVEAFLNKRNFKVFSESDLKDALGKLLELSPHYVFLAWDHPVKKVTTLPKLITQASTCIVIPYALGDKDAVYKLNFCPLSPKLFPPISGPSVERLILKIEKSDNAMQTQLNQQRKAQGDSQSKISTQMKTKLLESFDKQEVATEQETLQSEAIAAGAEAIADAYNRIGQIQRKNQLLDVAQKTSIPQESVDSLKNSFEEKVKKPLQTIIQTLNETNQIKSQPANNVIIEQRGASDIGIGYMPTGTNAAATKQNTTKNEKNYCMSIYSESWCGYLFITTAAELDFSTADLVFSEWLKTHFKGFQEIDEYDFFEINALDQFIFKNLLQKADYKESASIDDFELTVSFFPIEPYKMSLLLNEDKSLIKINTDDIPSNEALNFSLHLHLPENKKLLMYTPANKALSVEQKLRLKKNNVGALYTPIDFEKEFKRFMAEKNVREIYENLQNKLSAT